MSSFSRITQLISLRVPFRDSVGSITSSPSSNRIIHDDEILSALNDQRTASQSFSASATTSSSEAGMDVSSSKRGTSSPPALSFASGASVLPSERNDINKLTKTAASHSAEKEDSEAASSSRKQSISISSTAKPVWELTPSTSRALSTSNDVLSSAGYYGDLVLGNIGRSSSLPLMVAAPSRDLSFQDRVDAFNAEEIEKALQNIDEQFCRHFLKGNCRYKSKCKYSHELEACLYCKEKLPKSKVAASTHLSRCWKAALQVGVIQKDQLSI